MTTYTVFGATGNCGSSLIQVLLTSPDNKINAYCRNGAKLRQMFPEAIDSKRIKVYEGQIDNTELFGQCSRGSHALFLAVTVNANIPGVRMAQDMTVTLLAALRKLRKEGQKMPRIVVLSSASLEPSLCRNFPKIAHWVVTRANSNVYADLRVQENMLRAEQDWLTSIFVKPGGLVIDEQRGHKLNLEDQETFVSYLDLAAGMVEAADDGDNRYDMKNVSVNNVAGSAKFPKILPLMALCGVLTHFFPFLYSVLPKF